MEKEIIEHECTYRDAWLKNSRGTKHVRYCIICAHVEGTPRTPADLSFVGPEKEEEESD